MSWCMKRAELILKCVKGNNKPLECKSEQKIWNIHHIVTIISPLLKQEGNWVNLTLAKTSGTVTGDRKKIGQ